jgi:serine/threonine protein kinase
MKNVSRCATISPIKTDQQDHITTSDDVLKAARARLWESYRCITSPVLYLHKHSIRYKDLKPPNTLVSHNGLRITDFGHSTNFYEFSDSATTSGERGTKKYCALDVATFERNGRSSDVFSLACISFEMSALSCFTLEDIRGFRPFMHRSFHNNLHDIFPVFDTFGSTNLNHLTMSLAKRMLSRDPAERPNLASISRVLNLFQAFSTVESNTFASIQCPHHKSPPLVDSQHEECAVKELLITIGNTYHEEIGEVIIDGGKRTKYPIVVFVGCTSVDYIDTVIFFQVNMNGFSLNLTLPFILHASHMLKYLDHLEHRF